MTSSGALSYSEGALSSILVASWVEPRAPGKESPCWWWCRRLLDEHHVGPEDSPQFRMDLSCDFTNSSVYFSVSPSAGGVRVTTERGGASPLFSDWARRYVGRLLWVLGVVGIEGEEVSLWRPNPVIPLSPYRLEQLRSPPVPGEPSVPHEELELMSALGIRPFLAPPAELAEWAEGRWPDQR